MLGELDVDEVSELEGGVAGKVLSCVDEEFGEAEETSGSVGDELLNSILYVLELSGSFNFRQSSSSPKRLLKCRAF